MSELPSDLSLEMKAHRFAVAQRAAAAPEMFEPIFSPDALSSWSMKCWMQR